MPDLSALKAELAEADLVGLSDAAATTKLNADVETTTAERSVVPSREVFEAIDPTEWDLLTSTQRDFLLRLLGMGDLDLKGPNTRQALGKVFSAATAPKSRAAIVALQTQTTTRSRAVAVFGSPVQVGDVAAARRA